VVSKLYNTTRIALENEDHAAADLGGWHSHIDIQEKQGQKLQIDAGTVLQRRSNHNGKRK
jgi:hypothetical protein